MEQPQGFVIAGQEAQVCRLKKAIYGLKQAYRVWNLQFHGVLTELGFTQTFADAGVYVYHQHGGDGIIIINLYVDDITLMGPSLESIKCLKDSLSTCYDMTDLGEITAYLGMHIVHDQPNKIMYIDQSAYVSKVLEHFGMVDANTHNMPLPAGAEVHLVKYDGEAADSDIRHFQVLIGCLMYLQIGTRPDISFAVSRLAQYTVNPSPQHPAPLCAHPPLHMRAPMPRKPVACPPPWHLHSGRDPHSPACKPGTPAHPLPSARKPGRRGPFWPLPTTSLLSLAHKLGVPACPLPLPHPLCSPPPPPHLSAACKPGMPTPPLSSPPPGCPPVTSW
jgi:hypothetical protein